MAPNPEKTPELLNSLDGKNPDEVFDFSNSPNKTPDISKEQKGMKAIQKELE